MAVVAGPAAAVEAVGAAGAVAMVVAGIGERQMRKPQETCRRHAHFKRAGWGRTAPGPAMIGCEALTRAPAP
jgi:hypothetical protein